MTTEPIKTLIFSSEGQTEFAALSGDWNPMHMSPMAARRTQSGRPVVHGVHTLLRSLDGLAASLPELPLPSKLTVRFPAPVYIGDTVGVYLTERTDRQLRAQARVDGTTTADLRIGLSNSRQPEGTLTWGPVENQGICRELSLAEMAGRSGTVVLATTPDAIRAQLPDVSRWLGVERVGALMCLSRLVGMECPGLHSLFSGFTIEFAVSNSTSLRYRVASVDDHFRLLNIEVDGLGIKGSVEAFARHSPIRQKPIGELSTAVHPKEFSGQQALIIGGSRGLGELTAKLIAAGGGQPIITYAVGKEDAERVAAEIREWGVECRVLKYDARVPPSQQIGSIGASVTHLYYFATGQIFGRRTKEFEGAVFDEFLQFYVRGFYELCATLREFSKGGLSVFYPSSIAVEERPRNMTEYAMAKAAAEVLCVDLNRAWPSFRVTSVRLPRLLTDQTASVVPVESADPLATILPIVRKVQGFRF